MTSSTSSTSSPSMLSSRSLAMRTMPGAPVLFEKLEIARKSIFTGSSMWRVNAVRKYTEPLSTPISFTARPAYARVISAPTSRMRRPISSSVKRIFSIPGGVALILGSSYWNRPRGQPVFEDQVFKILLVEDLNVERGIQLTQQPHLAVLSGHQRLLHGGQLDIKVELRQVEIGGERLQRFAIGI